MPEGTPAEFSPFERALRAVEEWLDGPGAELAPRTRRPGSSRKVASWDLSIEHPRLGARPARFSLPRDFPASPPQVHVDKTLCLVLPHVEEDGKVCLGVESSPEHYENPLNAAEKVLTAFQRFLEKCSDDAWISTELHNERLAYWSRFCELSRTRLARSAPLQVRVVLGAFKNMQEEELVSYSRKGASARSDILLAAIGVADPHMLASRHGWAVGTLVRGHCLFVELPETVRWTPADWPKNLEQLESLVAQLTDRECSVAGWLQKNQDGDPHPYLVVLAQGTVCFGYVLTPALVAGLTEPGVLPVPIERVDAEWALARDHGLEVLRPRRKKRVLVLGCGSLGGPVAELLARAGIGELHLLDKETFESENCARHVLGLKDINACKAINLAKRLREQIPGIEVKGHVALVSSWIVDVCRPDRFDMVVDCTGESSVRTLLAQYRQNSLGKCPVVHAWMEPYCAAAHVVFLCGGDNWPTEDPANSRVNVARWVDNGRVPLPACGAGFHPYGAADAWQAAGFAVERLLAGLDGSVPTSTIWSWVRSKGFFDSIGADVEIGPLVPVVNSLFDAISITRSYAQVFLND